MGTWGTGNFDNDGARDYVAEVIFELKARVNKILKDDILSSIDEDGETILMPSIDLLYLICNHVNTRPLKTSEVSEWKEKYLQIYDEQIDSLGPAAGYKEERRKTIEETFSKLEGLSR